MLAELATLLVQQKNAGDISDFCSSQGIDIPVVGVRCEEHQDSPEVDPRGCEDDFRGIQHPKSKRALIPGPSSHYPQMIRNQSPHSWPFTGWPAIRSTA